MEYFCFNFLAVKYQSACAYRDQRRTVPPAVYRESRRFQAPIPIIDNDAVVAVENATDVASNNAAEKSAEDLLNEQSNKTDARGASNGEESIFNSNLRLKTEVVITDTACSEICKILQQLDSITEVDPVEIEHTATAARSTVTISEEYTAIGTESNNGRENSSTSSEQAHPFETPALKPTNILTTSDGSEEGGLESHDASENSLTGAEHVAHSEKLTVDGNGTSLLAPKSIVTSAEGAAAEEVVKISMESNTSTSTRAEHVLSPVVSNSPANASSITNAIASPNVVHTFTIYDSDDEEITVTYAGSHFPAPTSSGAVAEGLVKRENDRISGDIAYADVLVNKENNSVE